MSTITILGLGPGDVNQLTLEAWRLLEQSKLLYVRTLRHPMIDDLPKTLQCVSFDHLYETANNFGEIYLQIAHELIEKAKAGEAVLYAVPGHPLVAEASTRHLLKQAADQGISYRVVDGLSFIEPTCTALHIDPLEHGLQLLDALDLIPTEYEGDEQTWADLHDADPYMATLQPYPLIATRAALLCQVYSSRVAADVKLSLMERYPADHPITIVRGAGIPGAETIWTVPLFELDRQTGFDHLTCAYVPALEPLEDRRSVDGLSYVFNRLLGPGGCPWDHKQTHESLRGALLEETHEVLEAIDAGDFDNLSEELGDLLANIISHSEMGRQAGLFDFADVCEGAASKLIRRHPHVFGDASAGDSGVVVANWEAIKQQERAEQGKAERGTLDGIPMGLPALAYGQELSRKAAKQGFEWAELAQVWAKCEEELQELQAVMQGGDADRAQRLEEELGDLLFALGSLARWLDLDAETALRSANAKFRRRFHVVEQMAKAEDKSLKDYPLKDLLILWQSAKQAG